MKSAGFQIEEMVDDRGRSLFRSWYQSLKDKKAKQIVQARIRRLSLGNLGDCKSVGSGVFELRIHYGQGLRIYFGIVRNTVVLLLCGGEKRTQDSDIQRAKILLVEHRSIGR